MSEFLEIHSLSAIEHVLNHTPERARWLSVAPKPSRRLEELSALAKKQQVEIRSVSDGEPRLSLLPFDYAPWSFVETLGLGSSVVVLDHLQDPQNFGAIIRSAEAFGVNAVVIPKDRSVTVTSAVYTASAGAVETIPIVMATNVNDRIRALKELGFWIVGAHVTEKSTPPWEVPQFEKVVLVLGTEFEGLKPSTVAQCDWVCRIPMNGKIDSLNVSAAAAILFYELRARRMVQ